jgi:hypothetical protein
MSDRIVTCDDLARVAERDPRKGVAVLVLLAHAPDEIQFVTYGRTAADKVEAHELKEWIKRQVFEGKAPEPKAVHESFILDAAVNRERLDRCVKALRAVLDTYGDRTTVRLSAAKHEQCIDAVQFATGTGAYASPKGGDAHDPG